MNWVREQLYLVIWVAAISVFVVPSMIFWVKLLVKRVRNRRAIRSGVYEARKAEKARKAELTRLAQQTKIGEQIVNLILVEQRLAGRLNQMSVFRNSNRDGAFWIGVSNSYTAMALSVTIDTRRDPLELVHIKMECLRTGVNIKRQVSERKAQAEIKTLANRLFR